MSWPLVGALGSVALWVAVGAATPLAVRGQGPAQPPAQTADANAEIARAIAELSSASFAQRQAAMLVLKRAGSKAIPRLAQLIDADDADAQERAFRLLEDFALSKPFADSQAALQALDRLAQSPQASIALPARQLADQCRAVRSQRIVEQLRFLGATVTWSASEEQVEFSVRLYSYWRGNPADLELVLELDSVVNLHCERSDIDDRYLIAIGRMTTLEQLSLGETAVTDAGLVHLRRLQRLQSLSVQDTAIGDEGLRLLADLPNLETLRLDNTRVTDLGLSYLNRMPQLQRLSLSGAAITSEGVRSLGKLRSLTQLNLSGTNATGPGLEALAECPNLERLDLQRSPLDDAAMQRVGVLTQVRQLLLDSCPVADEQLRHLGGMKQLEVLWLSRTPLTNDAIPHLKRLTSLKTIYAYGSKISAAGKKELEEDLPTCRLHH